MKTFNYAVAISLLAGLGACSSMTGGSGSATRSAAVTQPTVAPEMVRQVQSKLRDGGYYKQGAVDGVWGPGTETAVRSFQADHNLGSSGQLDVPTLQALNLSGTQYSSERNPPATQPTTTNPNYNPNVNPNVNPNTPPIR